MKNKCLAFAVAAGLLLASQVAVAETSDSTIDFSKTKAKYYGAHLCGYDEFRCVPVKRGDSWKKLFPNQRQREIVKRLNRTNTSLGYRRWIVVPTNLDQVEHLDLSPFPGTIKATGGRLVVVNLGLHAFAAYDQDGKLVHWGPVSGGKGWCPDIRKHCNTAVGVFKVVNKQGPRCISKRFPVETAGGAPMPWCMHYFRGFALHGSTLPGFHASHGCIRLFKDDAKWLNQHFVGIGTQVIVTR